MLQPFLWWGRATSASAARWLEEAAPLSAARPKNAHLVRSKWNVFGASWLPEWMSLWELSLLLCHESECFLSKLGFQDQESGQCKKKTFAKKYIKNELGSNLDGSPNSAWCVLIIGIVMCWTEVIFEACTRCAREHPKDIYIPCSCPDNRLLSATFVQEIHPPCPMFKWSQSQRQSQGEFRKWWTEWFS